MLLLLLPPFPSAGNYSTTISPGGFRASESVPEAFSVSTINIEVLEPFTRILSVLPDPIRHGSSGKLQILISAMTPLQSASDLEVYFGDTEAFGIEVLASDVAGTLLSLDQPNLNPGVVEVQILDLRSRVIVRSQARVQRGIIEVKCVSGCEPELSGGIVTLEVDESLQELESRRRSTLDAASMPMLRRVDASKVRVSLDGIPLVVHSQNAGPVLVLRAEVPPSTGSIAHFPDPITVRFLEVRVLGDPDQVVPIRLAFRAPPRVQVATFSSDGRAIMLELDQDGEAFLRVDCSNVVDSLSLLSFGSRPSCAWTSGSEISITLGTEATVQVGDIVNVTAQLRLVNGSDQNQAGLFQVHAPMPIRAPVLSLVGPEEVGGCEEAVLTAMAPDRRPTFQWVALNDAALNLSISSVTGSELRLPPPMIREGDSVDIMVCPFLSLCPGCDQSGGFPMPYGH